MKGLKVFKKIVIIIIVVLFFVFAIANTFLLLNINKYKVTKIDKNSWIVINDKVSSDKYKKGDLVIVKEKKITELKVGEEVFTYKVNREGEVKIDIGIIGEIYDPEGEDDDAVVFENGSTYGIELVVGTAEEVHPEIGSYISVFQSQWGFLFIILVPSFLIFIYQIYAIIVEIKYGKE